jgi:hypothetical protein
MGRWVPLGSKGGGVFDYNNFVFYSTTRKQDINAFFFKQQQLPKKASIQSLTLLYSLSRHFTQLGRVFQVALDVQFPTGHVGSFGDALSLY